MTVSLHVVVFSTVVTLRPYADMKGVISVINVGICSETDRKEAN